jgi:hypothetical protein
MEETVIRNALQEFYNDNIGTLSEDAEFSLNSIWDAISCEVYLKTTQKRCNYLGGQEFPEFKFNLIQFCFSFEDFPACIEDISSEIFRVSKDREIETIFISDRLYDGSVDLLEWQFNF